jgi:hypothetical protein
MWRLFCTPVSYLKRLHDFAIAALHCTVLQLYRDESTAIEDKLFSFPEDRNEISIAKGKLSQLAAKWG